jgi:predicted ArsR family transcriptional regulator
MSTARMSPRRREVLDVLRAAGTPLDVAETAGRMGVHPNTVRFHLQALAGEGFVERQVLEPVGRGRPRTVYTPRAGMDRGGTRGYRLLARMLLSGLAATGPEAPSAAVETGRAWGRFLVEPLPPFRPPTAEESAARLGELLDGLRFAPETQGGPDDGTLPSRIRLRHCPFLELAEEYGQLVCPLHLALMQGALAELGAPLTATELEPFVEPDVCLAHLAPAPRHTAEPAERQP